MPDYPFLDKVNELLDARKEKLIWLAAQIDRSDRWFYGKKNEFEKIEIGLIEKISQALDYNFMDDYNQWRLQNHQESMYIVHEPEGVYEKPVKRVGISFRITTTLENAEVNSSEVLSALRKACEKYGYEFELL